MVFTMDWPEDVPHEAREITERFFSNSFDHEYRKALMLAFAYGYLEYENRQWRERVLADFLEKVNRLNVDGSAKA